MSGLKPISHKQLVARLRKLGFTGPYAGSKHLIMIQESKRLVLPNVHGADIGVALLARILKQAGISIEEWLNIERKQS